MALTHSTATRNSLADLVVDALDLGAGDAAGDLVIATSADVAVATLSLSNPAAGAASSGTATFNAITSDTNAAGGTAAKFFLRNRSNTEVVRGSVTATGGGGDIELSSVTIAAADTVAVSSLTYTASA